MAKRDLKASLKYYSSLGMGFSLACRNTNQHVKETIIQADSQGWLPELYDMFGMGDKDPCFKESHHEGMRNLSISDLEEMAPQIHMRLVVRVLTNPWNRKSIKKRVYLNERRQQNPDRHA